MLRVPRPVLRTLGVLGGVLVACQLLVAGAAADAGRAPNVQIAQVEFPKFGGPFTLTSHRGERLKDTDFRGRLLLVVFGYTYCPDFCPTNLQAVSQALDLLGDAAAEVQPLFVTVDPERDTAGALADYVPNFHPSLIGLTGSPQEIAAVAKAYRVHYRKTVLEDADDYVVDHSTFMYLMDREGQFATMFLHGTRPEDMAETIRRYL